MLSFGKKATSLAREKLHARGAKRGGSTTDRRTQKEDPTRIDGIRRKSPLPGPPTKNPKSEELTRQVLARTIQVSAEEPGDSDSEAIELGEVEEEESEENEIGLVIGPDGSITEEVTKELMAPKVTLTAKQRKKRAKVQAVLHRDAGNVLRTILATDVTPIPGSVTWTEDNAQILCSYNYSEEASTNTIYVPGQPPKWLPPPLPHTLEKDRGMQYSDYNYVRNKFNPFSPMFHALGLMNPQYQFNDVDVIADRNNLRKLLEFVAGKNNGPWRLDLYAVQNTLIIVKQDTTFWKNANEQSYGINFEKGFTTAGDGMEDATSHYRAIRYAMGPLNVVVRFEADAYHDGLSNEIDPTEAAAARDDMMGRPSFNYKSPILVLQRGHLIPSSQIAELKTSVYRPRVQKAVACMDQLWFGRTKWLFTGHYVPATGVVERVFSLDATEKVKRWEQNQQENLRKLAALLAMLKITVRNQQGPIKSVILARDTSSGPLVIRILNRKQHIFNRDFYFKHWARGDTRSISQRGSARNSYNGGRGRGELDSTRGYPRYDRDNLDRRYHNPGRGRGYNSAYQRIATYSHEPTGRGNGHDHGQIRQVRQSAMKKEDCKQ